MVKIIDLLEIISPSTSMVFSCRTPGCNVVMIDDAGMCKLFDICSTTIKLTPSPNVETYLTEGTSFY